MSVVFVPKRQRGKAQINQETIQRLLDENDQLVRCITEYMQKGRATDCVQYQQILHRNIVYLGTLADASTEILPTNDTVGRHLNIPECVPPRPGWGNTATACETNPLTESKDTSDVTDQGD